MIKARSSQADIIWRTVPVHEVRDGSTKAVSGFRFIYISTQGTGTRYYWVLLGTTGYYWVLLGTTGYYWVLLGITGYYLVTKLVLMGTTS